MPAPSHCQMCGQLCPMVMRGRPRVFCSSPCAELAELAAARYCCHVLAAGTPRRACDPRVAECHGCERARLHAHRRRTSGRYIPNARTKRRPDRHPS
jgi:hypothetical protein